MNSEKDDDYVSRELSIKDPNASGDARSLEEQSRYEAVPFHRDTNPSSSGDSSTLEDLDPFETVSKLGSEMRTLFSDWSQEFVLTKKYEDETMKKMDNLKKQAYMLEAEFLESKLEMVKKRITET